MKSVKYKTNKMVLSSNWKRLQRSESWSGLNKKSYNGKKGIEVECKKRLRASVNKPKAGKSKIMNMVAKMNEEMMIRNKCNVVNSKLEELLKKEMDSNDSSRKDEIGKHIALDCEFVGVGVNGNESALARVSIVNFYGQTILDLYVKPKKKVTDWRTWVSGIKASDMKKAVSFEEAQKQVFKIISGRILIGHAIFRDLKILKLSHPRSATRDTSTYMPFRTKYGGGKAPSLRKLSKEILNLDIQGDQHSSVEDARATLLLYKSCKDEFELASRRRQGNSV